MNFREHIRNLPIDEAIGEALNASIKQLKERWHISKRSEFASEIGLTEDELTNRLSNGKTSLTVQDFWYILRNIKKHDPQIYDWFMSMIFPNDEEKGVIK